MPDAIQGDFPTLLDLPAPRMAMDRRGSAVAGTNSSGWRLQRFGP